jgi:ATP-dependent RNA helicase DeaD
LSAARDRAATAAEALRARVAARLEAGGFEPELGLLEPLLQRYDAAEVAAALLALHREPLATGDEPKPAEDWVKVFVNVGRKDRASAKDFVGALTREVGLARTDIGRVELRDAFSLLEIAPHAADKAIAGLTRSTIRGRRPDAHRDRDVRGR